MSNTDNYPHAVDRVVYFVKTWHERATSQLIAKIPDSIDTVATLDLADLERVLELLHASSLGGKLTITTTEEGQCVAVTRTDTDGQILSTLWEASNPSLGDDAHECLSDVVSHYHDFRTACIEIKAASETTRSDELYWQKQIDVLDRMKAQAERALSRNAAKQSSEVDGPAITADVHKDAERYRAVISDPEVYLALSSHTGMAKSVIDGAVDAVMEYAYIPIRGSQWKHHKGGIYTVLLVTSEPGEDKADKFPRSVVYRGEDDRVWTRTLESWYESFKLL